MGNNPHALVVPYPAEGHIIPLLELSQRLVKGGLNVTFVSTEYIHEKVREIMASKDYDMVEQINLALVKDGLSLEERKRPGKLSESVLKIMPGKVAEVIEQINGSSGDQMITCVVADQSLGWALDIAERKGIKRAAFCPAAAAMLVQGFSIPKLIDEGITNKDGTLAKKQVIKLSPEMPAMDTSNLVWASLGNTDMQKYVFQLMVKNNTSVKKTDWLLCNSAYDLEPAAFKLAPQILPVGPLLSSHKYFKGSSSSTSSCLKWLDQHQPKSVVYIAFGSSTILEPTQFVELALGLELSNRPFLWVVRTDNNDFPNGFLERVANNTTTNRGMVVKWAPQEKVLGHSSVGCFVSHCGWNSTVEGVSSGVPFLCWPYFADQFVNQSYVCDVWRVGLGFDRDENGVITRDEIRSKVERVMCDEEIKGMALELKKMAENSVKEGGSSTTNFKAFVEWIKS
ncbi:UDP-glycosyltransferase 83A1 [Morus notabilis]|uniref:UDP-glycosyltransferase 83A1 n=1 Tax=Morus notabilis TaxID=981085 RepID=W9QQZ0_9ROSA|nr:UDP-glycosyltransferase 83A1 [Morus notabilis]EXB38094.1 UDP-glycosyltransferase 83A1 [Morus notabilis]